MTGPERPHIELLAGIEDNLRIALQRLLEIDPQAALALAAGMTTFWWPQGKLREGIGWLERALAAAPDAPAELRGAGLFGAGFLVAHDTGDWHAAAKLIDLGIEGLANAAEPPAILGMLHCLRGECDVFNGDAASGVTRTRTGLAMMSAYPETWGVAFCLWNVAYARLAAGDLYLIHWPIPLKPTAVLPGSADDFVPPADVPLPATWQGMEAAVDGGLVRHIGVSNFSAKKLRELIPHCRIPIEVNQVERHPVLQQNELVAYCASQGIHVTAYSPLGSGDRPAFVKAPDAPVLLEEPVVRSIAELRRCTPAQVLLAWQLQQGVSVIPKSVTPKRLAENLAADEIVLERADMERLAALDRGYRLIAGTFWALEGSPWTLQTIWD